jgi:DMSO/TMAO reductase YedYZ molybdopterin-dependent catalytic subunit
MNTRINNNGLAPVQHNQPQPNLYDGYPLVDLNTWELEIEGLGHAVTLSDSALLAVPHPNVAARMVPSGDKPTVESHEAT